MLLAAGVPLKVVSQILGHAAARLLVALQEHYGVRIRAHQLLRQPDLQRIAGLVMPEGPEGTTDPERAKRVSGSA